MSEMPAETLPETRPDTQAKKLRLLGFALLALIQLLVPAWMIVQWENTLQSGQPYRFKTAPVDPYDLFRGRYVALGIENASVLAPKSQKLSNGQWVNVSLKTGPDGFAQLDQLSLTAPEGPYLHLQISSVSEDWTDDAIQSATPSASAQPARPAQQRVAFHLPFDRYYLEEKLAPEAETAYQQLTSESQQKTFIQVRVKDGKAVLEELYLDNQPVRQYLLQAGSQAAP